MDSKTKKQITKALIKKAVGFDTQETVEEFSETDGELKLLKRKVTVKTVPPDVSAVKLLLEIGEENEDLISLSDEELEKEKTRLLKTLEEIRKSGNSKM